MWRASEGGLLPAGLFHLRIPPLKKFVPNRGEGILKGRGQGAEILVSDHLSSVIYWPSILLKLVFLIVYGIRNDQETKIQHLWWFWIDFLHSEIGNPLSWLAKFSILNFRFFSKKTNFSKNDLSIDIFIEAHVSEGFKN